MIYKGNQWIGFYMIGIFVMKELNSLNVWSKIWRWSYGLTGNFKFFKGGYWFHVIFEQRCNGPELVSKFGYNVLNRRRIKVEKLILIGESYWFRTFDWASNISVKKPCFESTPSKESFAEFRNFTNEKIYIAGFLCEFCENIQDSFLGHIWDKNIQGSLSL